MQTANEIHFDKKNQSQTIILKKNKNLKTFSGKTCL